MLKCFIYLKTQEGEKEKSQFKATHALKQIKDWPLSHQEPGAPMESHIQHIH